MEEATWTVKKGLAQMLKGGVIMDVVTPEQARIAEQAGACAVMALERVPADIRSTGKTVGAGRRRRTTVGSIRQSAAAGHGGRRSQAEGVGAPYERGAGVARDGKLPVVVFCAGGVAPPADAALVMQLGAEGVFVG